MDYRQIAEFRELVWRFYDENSRQMPWRDDPSPYKVVLSEVMLQQTQVERVMPKFLVWVARWPDFSSLASASTTEVVREWKGLGYNRRALRLMGLAQIVSRDYAGKLPDDRSLLEALPGIGPNTAGAILAYAYNEPVVFIETNIRRVFLHHFFAESDDVHDRDVLPLIEAALDKEHPREWYWALMDYGSWLKTQVINPNRRSRHHALQSKFEGSNRQLRGLILEILLQRSRTREELIDICEPFEPQQVRKALTELVDEGFLSLVGERFTMKE